MKVCRKCKEEKPLTEFYANKSSSDGRILYCRSCSKALKKVWYAENQEKVKAASAAYRAANQEKVKAASTAYRAANQEKLRANSASWRAANPEKVKANNAAQVEALSDGYIADRLGLPLATIPQELVNLKREQLKMRRATKQLTKTIKEIQDAT